MDEKLRCRLALGSMEAELEYALLSSETEIEGASVVTYGISAKMLTGDDLIRAEIHDIAPDREQICGLMRLICEGAVPPENLMDIIEDFIV